MQKYQNTIQDKNGNGIVGASVLVQSYPGAVTSTIYSDNGVTTQTNPIVTDAFGNVAFYAADGAYQLVVSGSGIASYTLTDIRLATDTITIIKKSFVQVVCPADTTEDILATINVPALKANDMIRVWATFGSAAAQSSARTPRIRFGGIGGVDFSGGFGISASTLSNKLIVWWGNQNATNSQRGTNPETGNNWQFGTSVAVTAAVDTSVPTTIVITGQKVTAGDTMTLDGYLVELISDGT